MPIPVYFLALAVFAMGTSEFMLAGILPDIAADLDVSMGTAGLLTSAFAVGMVVGAPAMAALSRTWPQRAGLVGFLVLFLASHVVGAITGSFIVLLATRIVAALANAGFLAIALTAASGMVAADKKGRALAVLLAGTTIATVAGVPGGALLGAALGWRATFWAVALICVPAIIAILRGVPARHGGEAEPTPNLLTEFRELRRPRLILAMCLGAMVNAATFGTFTYIAPIVTDVAELGANWVPVILVLFGIGSFTGVTVAGRYSDERPQAVIAIVGPFLCAGWIAFAVSADNPVALPVLAFAMGAMSFALGSTLIARVLYEGAGALTMAGSYATAALNVGAAAGPVLAGLTLSRGALGPVWASAVLVAASLAVVVVFRRSVLTEAERRESRQGTS
ncbi:Cmx/CmrA family chloramphenicol efflux MFS transporter [Salininema proteolyticum]|uniref:Cmx/CmrA family chloramphenicol efflux MFS transporter n=1 Tax=Salininema proteolyticum TaxID=1607685 RepID=A0ABV8U3J8_9ACTN